MPRSKEFDDVYFSVQDGLAETRHVFLDSNELPSIWEGRDRFTICETGFGTGLNFLAALKLWQDAPEELKPKELHFISFEKFPVSLDYIKHHLSHWEELSGELEILLDVYSEEGGVFDVMDGVKLTLIIGDVNEEMPKLNENVECWFLDGFKPSSNPDMWSETVFSNMARLSITGAHFATFTAAGFVRRGLEAVGFEIKKVPGFGRKKEMAVGVFKGES